MTPVPETRSSMHSSCLLEAGQLLYCMDYIACKKLIFSSQFVWTECSESSNSLVLGRSGPELYLKKNLSLGLVLLLLLELHIYSLAQGRISGLLCKICNLILPYFKVLAWQSRERRMSTNHIQPSLPSLYRPFVKRFLVNLNRWQKMDKLGFICQWITSIAFYLNYLVILVKRCWELLILELGYYTFVSSAFRNVLASSLCHS